VHTQIELDMDQEDNNTGTTMTTAVDAVMTKRTADVVTAMTTLVPAATISPEKCSNVNKYPHLAQFFGSQFDPSNSKTEESIHTVLSEIIDILHPRVGEELKVKNSGNHSWVLFL
jgi:hypothetical protein